MEFENQIEMIDIKGHEHQKIKLSSEKVLGVLLTKINILLTTIFQQIEEINRDRFKLQSLNKELETTYGKLLETEIEVSRQKENLEALFKNSQNAIAMFDQNHYVVDINTAFTQLFGYRLEEIKGIHIDNVVQVQDNKSEAVVITKTVFGSSIKNHTILEDVRYGKDGKPLHLSIQIIPIYNQDSVTSGYGIYSDISERKQKEARLIYLSNYDELTGLYNRLYFERYMEKVRKESNLPIGIMMVDINGLKIINDAFGNKTGDQLLLMVSNKLKEVCVQGEIIARMGGDEFYILVEKSDWKKMEDLSKSIMRTCNHIKVHEVSISVCVGYGQLSDMNESYTKILKEAENYLNKRKLTELPSVQSKAIYTIMHMLHEKNKREEQHSKRVSELSYLFGKALSLSVREVNELKTIGLLHDIGKIAIDEKILNKEGKLTQGEYEEIQKHPEIGYRILSTVNELSEIADYVLAHHESYDGTGYPKGLKGDEIPYLSRIITVIDAFDAMTSDRPYRKAMSDQAAYAELERFSGIQFDPDIVRLFMSYMGAESEVDREQIAGLMSY